MRGAIPAAAAVLALTGCGGDAPQPAERSAGGDGEVRMQANGNSVTVAGPEGSARIEARPGGDTSLPGGLPAYPRVSGGQAFEVDAQGGDGGTGRVVSFQTEDGPEQVIAFYREAAQRAGFEVRAAAAYGPTSSLTAEHPDGGGLTVSATGAGGTTTVSIIVGTGG